METLEKKLVEFHIGRGSKSYYQGYLTFCGVGSSARDNVISENYLAFENESKIIDKWEDEEENITDLITDLDCDSNSKQYAEFCIKYGELGKVVVNSCDGNYIGDYAGEGEEYFFDLDGDYDTTYGRLVESFDDLNGEEQGAVNRSEVKYLFELAFGEMETENIRSSASSAELPNGSLRN